MHSRPCPPGLSVQSGGEDGSHLPRKPATRGPPCIKNVHAIIELTKADLPFMITVLTDVSDRRKAAPLQNSCFGQHYKQLLRLLLSFINLYVNFK